jgi:hypothetical protein
MVCVSALQLVDMPCMQRRYITQGDSGRKFNIWGGDSVGHCEKKSLCRPVSDSEWLPK